MGIPNDLNGMQYNSKYKKIRRPKKRNELSTTWDRNLILKGENTSLNNHRNRRNGLRPSDKTWATQKKNYFLLKWI